MDCSVALTENSARVLIAEDQPAVSEALRILLKGEGYQTEQANSPAGLMRAVEGREFDVVLLDLNYTRDTTSGREGLELVERLQRRDSTLPVVVMTAWGNIELAVESVRRGARDFIEKPWENRRLLDVVREQIARGKEQRKTQREKSRRKNEQKQDLADAQEIQRGLLPRHIRKIQGIEIAAAWQPARGVSGDYFDIVKLDEGRAGIAIADVAGKGLAAALVMSSVQAAVRMMAAECGTPSELCARVNRLLCGNLSPGRFVTFFYAVLDAEQRVLSYANAGHNAPILARADGSMARLHSGGAVLGEFPEWTCDPGVMRIAPGDGLVLFTDGVSEARDAAQREFGEQRLAELAQTHLSLSAEELRMKLMDEVRQHCAGAFDDDATVLVIKVRQ